MLESIEIKNFKRIGPDGLKLNNLAKVNYLVGKNGCGKSSVLELLFSKSIDNKMLQKILSLERPSGYGGKMSEDLFYAFQSKSEIFINGNSIITLDKKFLLCYSSNPFLFSNLDIIGKELYRFSDDYFADTKRALERLEGRSGLMDFYSDIEFTILPEEIKILYLGIYNIGYKNIDIRNIESSIQNAQEFIKKLSFEKGWSHDNLRHGNEQSSGQYYLTQMLLLHTCVERFDFKYLLFEEPESLLHPDYQKLIPSIMNFLVSKGIQVIISTHSPFIISAAGEFPDTQKVYMIEDGKCLNPEGSSGKDVKGIAATMLGAGIEDLTPSIVVFCAETEALFLETINTKFYFRDIKFLTPFNGSDGTIINLEKLVEAGKFNHTFYKGAKFWYYLDHPNEHQLKSKRYQELKEKAQNQANLILSDKTMFELKFTDDIVQAKEWHKQATDFAKEKAEYFINNSVAGKAEFEGLFGELGALFGFPEPKK
jgi:AAA domain, putative AbiEii toxin, Type IV TA system